jgi:hypothetical protein
VGGSHAAKTERDASGRACLRGRACALAPDAVKASPRKATALKLAADPSIREPA